MKNQGFWITRLVSLALGAAVLFYMVYHIAAALDEPLQTVTSVRITMPHTTPVNGVVVRTEYPVSLPAGLVAFSVDEGEHVSTGQTLAVTYQTQDALERRQRVRELEKRLSLLSHIQNQSAAVTDIARLDSSVRSSLAALLSAAASGRPAQMNAASLAFRSSLFQQEHAFDNEDAIAPLIDSLNAEIASLSQGLGNASGLLRADSPGLFSASTDGLEGLWTESALESITVERFHEWNAAPPAEPSASKGKLVRGWSWYYVCLLPVAETGVEGGWRDLRFADGALRRMRIHYVSDEADGLCVVVYSSNRYLAEVLSERKTDAEIVWSNYDGVRVPHNGLRVEDGQHFVYCLVLGRVVRKNVTPVAGPDSDTFYLCAYEPGRKNALLPGDEIIVSGKKLYEGKVV